MIKINEKKETLFYNLFGSIRKITAMMLTIVFCYLTIVGKISSEQFIPVFSMVIGYYFGKSTALDIPGSNEESTIKKN